MSYWRAGLFVIGFIGDAVTIFEFLRGTANTWSVRVEGTISHEVLLLFLGCVCTAMMVVAIVPLLKYCWSIPKRRAGRKRAEEAREREEALACLRTVVAYDYFDENKTVVVAYEKYEPPEKSPTTEEVSIAREKLTAMGLKRRQMQSWGMLARALIPLVEAYGVRGARRKLREWNSRDARRR